MIDKAKKFYEEKIKGYYYKIGMGKDLHRWFDKIQGKSTLDNSPVNMADEISDSKKLILNESLNICVPPYSLFY